MEGTKKRVFGSSISPTMVFLFLGFAILFILPMASATKVTVGGKMGWTTNFNYTTWAKDKHFYNGDWLCKFFFSIKFQLHLCTLFRLDLNLFKHRV
jgi:hypothetical protein